MQFEGGELCDLQWRERSNMAEVKVERPKTLARQETAGVNPIAEWFEPISPVGRFFGLSPFALMREFTEEMDRAFHGTAPALKAWAPKVDIHKTDGTLLVTAELPGLKKEEVKVEMTDTNLIIEGERKLEQKEDREGYHRYERTYGNFYRSIPLPEGAGAEQVKAELTDGVLKVTIPVPEAKKNVREIKVEGAAAEKKPVAA